MAEYFYIDEQSTTITVTVSGVWEARFNSAFGGTLDRWYTDGGTTDYADYLPHHRIHDGVALRYQNADSSSILTLVESTPSRVVMRSIGEMGNTAGHDFEMMTTVYPSGYIFYDFVYTNTTSGAYTPNYTDTLVEISPNYTNETAMKDNDSDPPTYNDDFWYGYTSSTPLNSILLYVLYADPFWQQEDFVHSGDYVKYETENPPEIAVGESARHSVCLYLGCQETTQSGIESKILDFKNIYIS